jgi:hypothetical protein
MEYDMNVCVGNCNVHLVYQNVTFVVAFYVPIA